MTYQLLTFAHSAMPALSKLKQGVKEPDSTTLLYAAREELQQGKSKDAYAHARSALLMSPLSYEEGRTYIYSLLSERKDISNALGRNLINCSAPSECLLVRSIDAFGKKQHEKGREYLALAYLDYKEQCYNFLAPTDIGNLPGKNLLLDQMRRRALHEVVLRFHQLCPTETRAKFQKFVGLPNTHTEKSSHNIEDIPACTWIFDLLENKEKHAKFHALKLEQQTKLLLMEQQKRFFRIEALHNSGEYKKLLEPGEKYLELYPEDKVATMYLATGLLVTGNYVAAARRLNLAEKMPLALHEKKWAQELRQNLYKAILEKRREKKSPAAHVSAKRQPASIHQ